ncbi:MAG: flavodoxin family protein [Methanosphaera sp.]|nr:flavodoxin family protein [Methanosphaera sp.]
MKFYLINGSNRKKYNTAKVLDSVAEGIADKLGEEKVENFKISIVNLYDLEYKGCKSCFHCKKIEGKYYGQCPIKDDLQTLLPKIWNCDGLVLASPIYFGNVTGEMRSFLERLFFPKFVYGKETLAKSKPNAFIYTMNVTQEMGEKLYSKSVYDNIEGYLEYTFGKPYSQKVYDTYQFKDYSLYENYIFNEEDKAKVRDEQFPKDLEEAYKLGVQIVADSLCNNE